MQGSFDVPLTAKIPTEGSPRTDHFCVAQFGSQEWFKNLARFPFLDASRYKSGVKFMK